MFIMRANNSPEELCLSPLALTCPWSLAGQLSCGHSATYGHSLVRATVLMAVGGSRCGQIFRLQLSACALDSSDHVSEFLGGRDRSVLLTFRGGIVHAVLCSKGAGSCAHPEVGKSAVLRFCSSSHHFTESLGGRKSIGCEALDFQDQG
ncbi:hypothetical protein BaRGS_00016381, partial [Batillaria attramentaria]